MTSTAPASRRDTPEAATRPRPAWRLGARAPWRAEVIGLVLALLMAVAFVTLLLASMASARERRLGAADAQRVRLACESLAQPGARSSCRQAGP